MPPIAFDNDPNAPPQQPYALRENRAAIAGLIAANIGFVVPFIGGLTGIAFGIVGLRRTRDPHVGGKGLSIAAIVVGVLSVITSAVLMWSLYARVRSLPAL